MKKLLAFFVLVLAINTALFSYDSSNIKVGYIGYPNFISESEDGSYYGYAVDYFNEISKYTGFSYEYVRGNLNDIINRLKKGEIDLLCSLRIDEESLKGFSVSRHTFSPTQCVLFSRADDLRYDYEDWNSFNGMKVGFLLGSSTSKAFESFARRNGFSYIPLFYDNFEALNKALIDKEVDAIATIHMYAYGSLKLLSKFDNQPFYLFGNKDSDLMSQIDYAMGQIVAKDPNFQSDLFSKYYSDDKILSTIYYTAEEKAFIEKILDDREAKTGIRGLKVPVYEGQNPLSYRDKEGNLVGIYIDILDLVSERTGLNFYVDSLPSRGNTDWYDYFRENGFDFIIMPDSDMIRKYDKDSTNGVNFSASFATLKKVIIAKRGLEKDDTGSYRIAYYEDSTTFAEFSKEIFPLSTLVPCESLTDCLDAVKEDRADIVIHNQYILERQLSRPQYEDLVVIPNRSYDEGVMLSPIIYKNGDYNEIGDAAIDPLLANPLLITIINKAIRSISDSEIDDIIIHNTVGNHSDRLTTQDFIYENRSYIAIFSLLFLAFIVLLIILFITKQKNMNRLKIVNQQLEISVEKAEIATRAKSDFLSHMSHEIRTPINAIVGLTTIAKKNEDNKTKILDCLSKIETSSEVLLNIVNDVLDMSAIENNKLKLICYEFDIKTVLKGIFDIYYTQCKAKNINFTMHTSIVHEKLYGDFVRTNQILINFVSNAFKFTPSNGSITIDVKEIGFNDGKAYLRFIISDTGIGISPDLQKRLFRPFEQENTQTSQKFGGSGLGLSIAKNLTQLMHGIINVESTLGKGTTFTIDLPFEVAQHQDCSNYGNLKNFNVIVVEENRSDSEYIGCLLNNIGVKYSLAKDVNEALDLMEEAQRNNCQYDVAFISYLIPDSVDVELLENIREKYSDMHLVIISAGDVDAIASQLGSFKVDAYLNKPIFQSVLFDTLLSFTDIETENKVEKQQNYDFKGYKVLLAEDNVINTEIATELLKMVNVKVDHAENGKVAVDIFTSSAENEYFAILMDVQMPIMNGYEATIAIRTSEHPQAKTIPIIAMTANAFTEDVSHSLSCGMNAHLSKPIDTKLLYSVLFKALSDEFN